jgi:hypothetical protein
MARRVPSSLIAPEVKIAPVSTAPDRHTIHTYYLTCPESPDGTRVLFFAATDPRGHHGDLIVRERASGKETVIARGIDTEDAHRAACQQWIGGGRRVAYHDVKDGRWTVQVVDLDTLADRKLAEDRQRCFGPETGDVVPISALTIADVERRHGEWLAKGFAGKPASIFFPNISPDGRRVHFKMSAPGSDLRLRTRDEATALAAGKVGPSRVASRFPQAHRDGQRLLRPRKKRRHDPYAEPAEPAWQSSLGPFPTEGSS